MKLLKSLQEAIEETTSINNVDDQAFDKDAHGEAPVAYSDAVISMQKRHKEIRKQLKDHQDAAEKELKISDADRINVETPKNDNLKKMHLSESLFEDFEEDGWPEELAEYEVLRKLEDLIYELNNTVRGANSGAKTFDELADYIDILAGSLSDMAHDIRSEYGGEELDEDLNNEDTVYRVTYKYSPEIFSSVMIKAASEDEAKEKFATHNDKEVIGVKEMSADEVEDMKHRGMSLLEAKVKEDSNLYNEDNEDSTPNPPALDNMGIATLLNSLIQDEWQAIQGYNDAIATLVVEDNHEDILNVFKDIVDEEHIHIGQLQKALETIAPNAESIGKGEEEGEGQLETSGEPTLDALED